MDAASIRVEYRCAFRPEALASPDPLLDRDGNGQATLPEKEQFLRQAEAYLVADLMVIHQRKPVILQAASFTLADDRGGFAAAFDGKLNPPPDDPETPDIAYIMDPAFLGAGAVAGEIPKPTQVSSRDGTLLLREGKEPVSSMQIPSQVQTVLPLKRPRGATAAGNPESTRTVTGPSSPVTTGSSAPESTATAGAPETESQRKLKALVTVNSGSPWVLFLSLFAAAVMGGLHALQPGHGKTVVAAYLVGSRGRIRDAVFLGLTVTFTHTITVILLGVGALTASSFIVPERMFGVLGIASGLLIFGLGAIFLGQRLRLLGVHAHGMHVHVHHPPHSHPPDHHAHPHGGHEHGHGPGQHTHELPDRVSPRALAALGISGGIVPCPDAIVVLLIAVALGRIGLGLAVILAFSAGLAAVLIAIGILMVCARPLVERWSGGTESRWLRVYLPIGSAAVVMLVGLALVVQVLLQQGVIRVVS